VKRGGKMVIRDKIRNKMIQYKIIHLFE